jgi:transposase
MKSATNNPSSALPELAPNDVTSGIDWARDDHAVAIVDGRGRQIHRCTVEHTTAGLRELVTTLGKHGVGEVAIERPDGPVVDTLLTAGLTVVVISPNQVKNLRGRYGSAGNKDDRFDAYVLADTLRTDRARLRPLVPDTEATTALRRACRARKDLVKHRVAAADQLRAPPAQRLPRRRRTLPRPGLRHQPGIPDPVRHPGPGRLAHPQTARRLAGQAGLLRQGRPHGAPPTPGRRSPRSHRRSRHRSGTHHRQLRRTSAHAGRADPGTREADRAAARRTHHAHIFTSLPRSGRVRAARLLAEIGDCRARFPTPESLTCLAGAAPSTRQSGKLRAVGFRWACDKQLRDAVVDFAGDTRHANPWAADLYDRARARGHDHAHAVRILALAWLHIIWHCWQDGVPYDPKDGVPYDPTQHRALQRFLATQNEAA